MGDIGGAFKMLMQIAVFGTAVFVTGLVMAVLSIWFSPPFWLAMAIMAGAGIVAVPIVMKGLGE